MKTNITEITPEQISAWKAQYVDIWKITVEDKSAILRAPDRKTLSYASSIGTKDPLKFNEILLQGCWLGGDMEIQTNDSYFISAGQQLAELITVKESKLEKL